MSIKIIAIALVSAGVVTVGGLGITYRVLNPQDSDCECEDPKCNEDQGCDVCVCKRTAR